MAPDVAAWALTAPRSSAKLEPERPTRPARHKRKGLKFFPKGPGGPRAFRLPWYSSVYCMPLFTVVLDFLSIGTLFAVGAAMGVIDPTGGRAPCGGSRRIRSASLFGLCRGPL